MVFDSFASDEESCDNLLPVVSCSSSTNSSDRGCENLFDGKITQTVTPWTSNNDNDWVQLNLAGKYYIKRLKFFKHSYGFSRTLYLQLPDGSGFQHQLKYSSTLDEVILPSTIISNHLNLSIKGPGKIYVEEIQMFGCHAGNTSI